MVRDDPSDPQYDHLATDFNEIYGLYRLTLTSPTLATTGGSTTMYKLRIYMRSHIAGITSEFVEYDFMEIEGDGTFGEDSDPVTRRFTFRSFNDIEAIEIHGTTDLVGQQTITIEKLRTSSVYDSNPTAVVTLTGMDSGQVISVQGIINVEAVPGSDLRVDVKPEDNIKDGGDIHAARNLRIVLRKHLGYDFISTTERYKEILSMVREQGLCERCVINKAFIGAILPMLGKAA